MARIKVSDKHHAEVHDDVLAHLTKKLGSKQLALAAVRARVDPGYRRKAMAAVARGNWPRELIDAIRTLPAPGGTAPGGVRPGTPAPTVGMPPSPRFQVATSGLPALPSPMLMPEALARLRTLAVQAGK